MRSCPLKPLIVLACLGLASCAAPMKEMAPTCPEAPVVAPLPPPAAEVAPPAVPPVALKPVPPQEVPVFEDDLDYAGLAEAIRGSIDYYQRCGRTFEVGGRKLSGAQMAAGLRAFAALIEQHPSPGALNEAVRDQFEVYASAANDFNGGVLFTGYYEPLIEASRTRSERFRWPLYKKPADMIAVDLGLFRQALSGEKIMARLEGDRLVPYYSREEIATQLRLEGKVPEICWVADPIDLFFLQIQGSGVVHFEDGSRSSVHYAASNGRAFRGVGKFLVDEGRLPSGGVSMQAIRKYLEAHPEEIEPVLNYNESYVFFEEVPDGPLGNIGVVLSPGRSIATDYRLFPGGALAFVATRKPVVRDGQIERWENFGRFVLNQDTGGVITGPGRVDFFWGDGPEAELAAGGMCERGRLYFLVKKRTLPEQTEAATAKTETNGNGVESTNPQN